jgi:PhnB protein
MKMSVKPIPAGYHTVTPFLTVAGAVELIEFLKQAFDAREKERVMMPNGALAHAEVILGDSIIMLGEPMGGDCVPMPGSFYLYVADMDAAYQRALEAGATSTMAPADMFWGDRLAAVKDRFGNIWNLATHVEDVSAEELQRRMAARFAS